MSSLDDVVAGLRRILSRLDDIDFWPPWEAAQQIVDLVSEAYQLVSGDFKPDSDAVSAAAKGWQNIAEHVTQAHTDLGKVPQKIGVDAWRGEDGTAFRSSVGALSSRLDTVDDAATGVHDALTRLDGSMAAARTRRTQALAQLGEYLSISWSDLNPFDVVDMLKGKITGIVSAIHDAIGAYEDAQDAVRVARAEVVAAMDTIRLPDHLSEGVSAVDVVNSWDDSTGPLRGSTLARYDEQFANLPAADQAQVRAAIEAARSDEERAWIMAAVASGMDGGTLDNYLEHLEGMTPQEIEALDPTGFRDGKGGQPDDTTCGSATLVMSRMMNDPAFAMWVITGYDPETGTQTGDGTESDQDQRFSEAALDMHDKTNSWWQNGQPQVPWPEAWGTTPGAVLNEMNHGHSGVPDASYDMQYVDPGDRVATYDRIAAASENGHTVPMFVGSDTAPRHVVLVTGSTGDSITVYDPYADTSSTGEPIGRTVTVSRADWAAGNFDVAGWDEPWGAVVPSD